MRLTIQPHSLKGEIRKHCLNCSNCPKVSHMSYHLRLRRFRRSSFHMTTLEALGAMLPTYNCRTGMNRRHKRLYQFRTCRQSASSVDNNKYGFDFSTARKDAKRDKVCPSPAWAKRPENKCPSSNAQAPFRSDTIWWTASLEPGTTINQIANKRSLATNQVTINSGIRYTCDEFPPASWVEGGAGPYLTSAGTTRCAAARCSPGINAEQDCTQPQAISNSSLSRFSIPQSKC